MAGEITSERRARSNRNGGRDHPGMAGDFRRNPQRAEAQRDSRDPKAETGGLLLLYPVAAFAIWVGLSGPRLEICDTAQWLLTTIGGVWIAWVSIRLLIRERHWYRVWVHYALGVLAFVGVTFALTGND